MIFSENLAMLRRNLNITQDELANYLKVSRSTIAGYETRNREPEYHILVKIADYFQVSIDSLLGHKIDTVPCPPENIVANSDMLSLKDISPENEATTKELISAISNLSARDLELLITLAKAMQKN